MILKTKTPIFPDPDKIRDEINRQFSKDLVDVLNKNIRNISDDIAALEKVERVTAFPTANLALRGKLVLLEGTGGGADGLYLCVDTGGVGFGFLSVTLT